MSRKKPAMPRPDKNQARKQERAAKRFVVEVTATNQPYPGLTSIAGPAPYEDSGFFVASETGFTWIFAMTKPTQDEINAIRSGPLKFSLLVEAPLVMMLVESTVFTAERAFVALPGMTVSPNTLFQVVLVDARNGNVCAVRPIGVSPAFAERLASEINLQAANVISPEAMQAAERKLGGRSMEENRRRAVATYIH